jgi:hypothetical protein
MQGMLGKIVSIADEGAADDGRRYRVEFKPVSLLLSRVKPPEWLKDQTLSVTRATPDPREIGRPGESIVLSVSEADAWLKPLVVSPEIAHDALPGAVDVRLRWWKDENPPEFRATANGITLTGKFTATGNDGGFHGSVDTAAFGPAVSLPLTIDIACDSMTASCIVVPGNAANAVKRQTGAGSRYHAENDWYALDLTLSSRGGALASLVERARGLDHFAPAPGQIAYHVDAGGQYDRYRTSWGYPDALHGVAVQSSGHRREGAGLRLSVEAQVDEGLALRASGHYTLFDALPLLVTQREYFRGKPKEDKPPDIPKEPIDSIVSFAVGFRSGTAAERSAERGSRVMASSGDLLLTLRSMNPNESNSMSGLRLDDGWAMIEHPGRRSYLLYLTDTVRPASFAVWTGVNEIAVEPFWAHAVLELEQTAGFATGLAAGETGGASAAGAWVACRSSVDGGTQRCAVIARLRDSGPATATIALGGKSQDVALETIQAPGVGAVRYAVATFDNVAADATLTASVAGIQGN